MKGNIQSISRKWHLGAIKPMAHINSQPFVAPGLAYNANGSIITFRDSQGNIKWIELRGGLLYECTPEDQIGNLLGTPAEATDDFKRETFTLTASETKTGIQPAKYAVLNVVVQNNDGSTAEIKMKQSSNNYLIGSSSFYKSVPGSAGVLIQQFSSDQEFYETAQDLIFEINGTGKNIDIYINFVKMY